MEVITPHTAEQLANYFELRWQVLREPLGQPRGSERDELDEVADHALLVSDEGEPLAAGRLHLNSPKEAQIRYMAVAAAARGNGLGSQIVEYLERIARERGASRVILNSRDTAAGFYKSLGYNVVGEGPIFAGISHLRMEKRL
jgi:predicted GNAT family N-acyltransferase